MRRSPLGRKSGLKPGSTPLARRTPLAQGDKPLARGTGLSGPTGGKFKVGERKPLKTKPKKARTVTEQQMSAAWRIDTLAATGGRCKRCGSTDVVQAHHVVGQQQLKAMARTRGVAPALFLWDARNGMALCELCHTRHERAVARVPRALLSESNVAFASDLGFDWYLERVYPS